MAPRAPAILTHEGERELRATLERLRQQLEVEFAARLRQARTFGEVTGNDDYLQTIEEEAVLRSRITRLEGLLNSATVASKSPRTSTAVAIGATVELEDVASGAVHERRMVGDFERLSPDAVSASSPVGRALIRRSAGDEVEVELPNGRSRSLRILAVEPSARG
ncbi:MAG: GreA/GreB family elongation factor [Solirubrobacterales bacterium]